MKITTSTFILASVTFVLIVALSIFLYLGASSSAPSVSASISSSSSAAINSAVHFNSNQRVRLKMLFSSSSSSSNNNNDDAVLTLDKLRGDAEKLCTLLILGFDDEQRICGADRSVEECVAIFGYEQWTRALHPHCTSSVFWRKTMKQRVSEIPVQSAGIPRWKRAHHLDAVRRSQLLLSLPTAGTNNAVPVSKRTYAQLDGVFVDVHDDLGDAPNVKNKNGSTRIRLHAIGFAIPTRNIRGDVTPHKFFAMNPALPRWCCVVRGQATPVRPNGAATQLKFSVAPDEEYTFQQIARHSYFAFSNRRGNFDCQRHTEILAQGTVPFMPELAWRCVADEKEICLPALPKALLREALALPGVEHWLPQQKGQGQTAMPISNDYFSIHQNFINVVRLPSINTTTFDSRRYFNLANRLLNFTRHHLTCAAMVAYMLRTMRYEMPRSVLLLVPEFEDYMSMAVECGFAELRFNYSTNAFSFGDEFSSSSTKQRSSASSYSSPQWPLWQRRVRSDVGEQWSFEQWTHREKLMGKDKLYGNGFTWGMRIDPPPNRRARSEAELDARVRAGEFDLVVAANMFFNKKRRWRQSVFEHMPLLNTARRALAPERIAFVDTEDYPTPVRKWDPRLREMLRAGSFVFSRELHEHQKFERRR